MKEKDFTILLIDDEVAQLTSLEIYLTNKGYNVFTAESGEQGIEILKKEFIDFVFSDFNMPGMSGLEVTRAIKQINPETEIIIITAYGTIEEAVSLMKSGAYDFLTKPLDLDALAAVLQKLREKKTLIKENSVLREQLAIKYRFDSIVSQNIKMENILNTAGRAAQSKATILIRGESGTGKELIAKAIHTSSPRKDKALITVNVAALQENLLESELFGHEKGAYTGATSTRVGRFQEADGGTLFIDEVGDIPMHVQVKLLRVIQFGEYQKIGANTTERVDVRIVAATHKNLEKMIADGEFREDLFYRLNVIPLYLPPLRERKEDIPFLAQHFIKTIAESVGKQVTGITAEALDVLFKHDFPGNIRELQNIIERAVILTRDEILSKDDLPVTLEVPVEKRKFDPMNLDDGYEVKMAAFERAMIDEALVRSGGNKSAAARLLGITERHLRSRLERVG